MTGTAEERLTSLERMTVALEAQGKAFMMIIAAAFAAMAENPETIRRAGESLHASMRAAAQQNAHVVIVSQLAQASTLLDALLQRKN
jgi:hypothetical protein